MIGPPTIVEPRYTTLQSAITRPRIAVGAASWSSEFVVAVKEMAAAPISTSAASARPSVGAAAMAARRAPKASAVAPSPVSDGLPRPAVVTAPRIAPAPIAPASAP